MITKPPIYRYNWLSGLKTELEPFFELDYVNLREDGYQESCAGTANLKAWAVSNCFLIRAQVKSMSMLIYDPLDGQIR